MLQFCLERDQTSTAYRVPAVMPVTVAVVLVVFVGLTTSV